MNAKKIGFIGLGLIGGSIAKAIRQYYPDYDIIAFDKNKESLALAIQEGTIHTSCSSIDDNFRGCNYIFLCAPVTYNAAYLSHRCRKREDFHPRRGDPSGNGSEFHWRTSDGWF